MELLPSARKGSPISFQPIVRHAAIASVTFVTFVTFVTRTAQPPAVRGKKGKKAMPKSGGAAFTLTELLVVLAVVSLLLGVAFSAWRLGIEKARAMKCLSNVKSLVTASLEYAGDNNQKLPPSGPIPNPPVLGGGSAFWYTLLRPYLGNSAMTFPSASNLPFFYCPSVDRLKAYPSTHYAANTWVFPSDGVAQVRLSAIPTPARLAMYTECLDPNTPFQGTWRIHSNQVAAAPGPYFSKERHGGMVSMGFCDGHAEGIPYADLVKNFTNYFGTSLAGQ